MKIVCEERTDEGLRTFKNDVCGTIRTIESGGCKRVVEKINKNQDQEYVNNISEEYSFAKKDAQEILNQNGELPNMFNPYNKSEVSDYAPTQTTSYDRSCSSATVSKKEDEYRIRKLTPKECWRLMGFSDEDFYKAKSAGVSDTQLYKQAGNSIVTCVLYSIYKEMYSAMPYLFEDLKLGSYFSGIGAFEKALDMLYLEVNNEK